MGDNVDLFDRNGVRTPMQWSPAENAGFSDAPADQLYAPVINDPAFSYQQVNVLNQQAAPDSLLHTIRRMIRKRKGLPVLARGTLEWLDELPPEAMCFWRHSADQSLLALHNLSDQPFDLYLPPGHTYSDALHSSNAISDKSVTLPAYGYRWLLAE
jgi:maltose alpha-D-glucosyltransferase/alpha-amylase